MSDCDNKNKKKKNCHQPIEDCDIFEPSVYTPDTSKFRLDYLKRMIPQITAELDAALLSEEVPEGEEPTMELQVTGEDPKKHFKFIVKYLRGPRGFKGSLDNFVVLSESEYERLRVKDPNVFYFTYEDDGGGGSDTDEVIDIVNHSVKGTTIEDNSWITIGTINNNTLNI